MAADSSTLDAWDLPLGAAESAEPDSTPQFVPWGLAHATVLVVTVVGACAMVVLGRRIRGKSVEVTVSRTYALVLFGLTLASKIYWFLPRFFVLDQSLPLHMSDVLRLICAYGLWSRRGWAVAVTFYWSLTLNIQSMLTPDLKPHSSYIIEFSSYWSLHVLVMWAPFFLTWGLAVKPTWRGYGQTLGVTVAWAAIVFAVNRALSTNYGYLNGKPAGPSLLDVFGHWPYYLLVELAAVVIVWALLTVAFKHRGSPGAADRIAEQDAAGKPAQVGR